MNGIPNATWVIGALIGGGAILVTLIIALWNGLSGRIARSDERRSNGDGELHDRIDTIKDTYARRDDVAGALGRVEKRLTDHETRTASDAAEIKKELGEVKTGLATVVAKLEDLRKT